jgi:hypothetical protein
LIPQELTIRHKVQSITAAFGDLGLETGISSSGQVDICTPLVRDSKVGRTESDTLVLDADVSLWTRYLSGLSDF